MPTRRTLLAASIAATLPAAVRAEGPPVIRVARIQGVNFLPMQVMQRRKLVEKHAARLGIPDGTAEWFDFPGGGNATDAMLSGSIDVVAAGPGNLLLLWDRTKGGVKGIVSNSALPAVLVTREERIKRITDYGPKDRIAVPTVLVSTPAILIQMACEQAYGAENWKRLDSSTVQMGHPDALIALKNQVHEVRSHFGSPPFIGRELREVPGAHVVTTSSEILGSPLCTSVLFGMTRYAQRQPGMIQALIDASAEAVASVRDDPAAAARDYLEVSRDKMPEAELTDLLRQPDMVFDTKPEGTLKFASFLHRTGTLKTNPAKWTDYFMDQSASLGGN